jgi:hypothetical protein
VPTLEVSHTFDATPRYLCPPQDRGNAGIAAHTPSLRRDIQQHVVHHGRSCIPTPRRAAHLTPYCTSSPYTASRWTGHLVACIPLSCTTPAHLRRLKPTPNKSLPQPRGLLLATSIPCGWPCTLVDIHYHPTSPPTTPKNLNPPTPPASSKHHLSLSTLRPCPHCHHQSNSHHMPYVRGRWRSRSCRQS